MSIRGLACMVPARGGARAVKKIALEFLPPDLGARCCHRVASLFVIIAALSLYVSSCPKLEDASLTCVHVGEVLNACAQASC